MRQIKLWSILLILLLIFNLNSKSAENRGKIEVMYFHATVRCEACITNENYIMASLSNLYSKELKDSTIIYKAIDFLAPENEHYQNDYKFDTQTLIVSLKVKDKETKWKNLDLIWEKASDFKNFQKYIELEINKFLKEIK